MYTSASATGSTSSVSRVPGPVLSKSVRKELLPVSTRPPPAFPVVVLGFRSEGKALVIELVGPASARAFRRRRKRNAPSARPPNAAPPSARYAGLSSIWSMKDGGGGGAFFAAALAGAALSAGFASAGFASAGFASAGFA